jgi:uroporphyrinogen decarboxylase
MKLKNDLFLRACKRQPVERTPIWIMRQAGRYLPEYREIRAKTDFLTLCKTPDLASEVTIQPVDRIGVDAAIIFSDILVVPEAMGMQLRIEEGTGPVFEHPIRTKDDAKLLKDIDPTIELKYVMEALRITKKNLAGRVPLIGFSGSPWTLLTYMVEGQGSKSYSTIKKFIFNEPALAHELLEKIAHAVAAYLSAQIASGANAVQIFDTWGGLLSPTDFSEFSLKYIEQVISLMNKKDEPVIVFSKGVHANLKELSKCGADVIGLDWTFDIGKVRKEIGKRVALQGNLDPTVLYGDNDKIHWEAGKVLESFGTHEGHIFNLGHGILPDVAPENAGELVEFVHKESTKYHGSKSNDRKEKHEKKKH